MAFQPRGRIMRATMGDDAVAIGITLTDTFPVLVVTVKSGSCYQMGEFKKFIAMWKLEIHLVQESCESTPARTITQKDGTVLNVAPKPVWTVYDVKAVGELSRHGLKALATSMPSFVKDCHYALDVKVPRGAAGAGVKKVRSSGKPSKPTKWHGKATDDSYDTCPLLPMETEHTRTT